MPVCAAALVPAAVAAAALRPQVIALEPYLDQEHFAFRGRIGGQEGLFQFDTGGGLTTISPPTALAAGCHPWGQLTGFRMRGERVDVPRCDKVRIEARSVPLNLPTAGVWDLSALLPKGAPPLAGNVALDAFAGEAVTLDLAQRQLIIETPASLKVRVAHARQVPIQVLREAAGYALEVVMGVETAAGRAWFELDSGNDAGLTVGRHLARLLNLDPNVSSAQPMQLQLAGALTLPAKAHVRELIIDGNIGVPLIRRWVVTLELPQQRLWLAEAPQGQPTD